jgi:hypothetical protein
MDKVAQINMLLSVARELGIEVRRAALGGDGGGLCAFRGRRVLFVDTDADAATTLQCVVGALAEVPELESRFIRPDLRELLDRSRGT